MSLHHKAQIACLIAALVATGATTAPAADPDWTAIGNEASDTLVELIRTNTTNPPGNETPAARVVAKRLEREGIRSEIIESAPGRGNIVARLPGSGAGRPIVLLSHLDVVPADPKAWTHPPFDGVREAGVVWGRGALDCKGVTTIQLWTLIALKRSGAPLGRDVILVATADEETGGREGAGWLTANRPDLVAGAEFLLNEGDDIRKEDSGRVVVQVATAEKAPCWIRLTATGQAGHGSAPAPQTAVTRLVRAVDRLQQHQYPVRVTPAVAAYFAAIAPTEDEPLRSRYAHLERAVGDPAFLAEFTRNPRHNALIRNTLTPTVLSASTKVNVIPAEATAELDCRLLPGERPEPFLAEISRLIDDDAVRVEPTLSFPASSSDPTSPLVAAIRTVAAEEFPGAPVVPSVTTGFTDSHWFRDLGIASYGFVPFVLTDDEAKTVHGADERVSVENLRGGVRRLVRILRALPSS